MPIQLPDSLLSDFRQFRGDGDASRFALGDCVDNAVIELAGKVTARAVYKAAAIETDLAIATVRLYRETAAAFDADLRDEFIPPLTFEHYRPLRYLDDRGQKRGYLAWCVESADLFGGRPAPAVKLEAKLRRDLNHEPPPPTFADCIGRALAAVTRAVDVAATDAQRDGAQVIVGMLEKLA